MTFEYNSEILCNIEEYFANLREIYNEKHIDTYEGNIATIGNNSISFLVEWCHINNIDPYATTDDNEYILIKWLNSWHN